MNKYGHRSPNSPASTAAPASRERLFAPPGRCPPAPSQPAPRSHARVRSKRSAARRDLSAEISRGSKVLLRESADAVAGMSPNANAASSPSLYSLISDDRCISGNILKDRAAPLPKSQNSQGHPAPSGLSKPGVGEFFPERRGTFSLIPGPGGRGKGPGDAG